MATALSLQNLGHDRALRLCAVCKLPTPPRGFYNPKHNVCKPCFRRRMEPRSRRKSRPEPPEVFSTVPTFQRPRPTGSLECRQRVWVVMLDEGTSRYREVGGVVRSRWSCGAHVIVETEFWNFVKAVAPERVFRTRNGAAEEARRWNVWLEQLDLAAPRRGKRTSPRHLIVSDSHIR